MRNSSKLNFLPEYRVHFYRWTPQQGKFLYKPSRPNRHHSQPWLITGLYNTVIIDINKIASEPVAKGWHDIAVGSSIHKKWSWLSGCWELMHTNKFPLSSQFIQIEIVLVVLHKYKNTSTQIQRMPFVQLIHPDWDCPVSRNTSNLGKIFRLRFF